MNTNQSIFTLLKKILKEQLLRVFKATGFVALLFCLLNLTVYTEISGVCTSSVYINISQVHASENIVVEGMEEALKAVIYLFVSTVAWFLTFGLEASAAIVDPALFEGIFGGMDEGLYDIWTLIRDVFNVFFIFILLFSAFATIFQVQKYHLLKSNVLVMIIIMALLVNFSWPITRVIMDAGNVTMYYLLDNFIDSDGPKTRDLFGMFGDKSDVMQQLAPDMSTDAYENQGIDDALFSLIILFAFACAFIVIAILFLIRISAFVLLLIFSPIGFAAAVFPGTQKFSDMWWDALFKWTFVGPILLFMIFIAIKFLIIMKEVFTKSYSNGLTSYEFVTNALLYGTALIMIYTGIAASQKIGGSAAQMAIGQARSMGKRVARKGTRWSGAALIGGGAMAFRGLDNKLGNYGAKMAGNVRGLKKRLINNESRSQEKWRRAKEDANAQSREFYGEQDATRSHVRTAIAEDRKRTKYQSKEDLQNLIADQKETRYYRQAAREELVSRKESIKTTDDLTTSLKLIGDKFEENMKLITNAAKGDAFEGSSADYKNLMDAIDSKTSMKITDKDRLKLKIKERYLEEESGKSVYEYHKSNSSSDKDALEATLGDSTIKIASKQEDLIKESSGDVTIKNFYEELAINQHNKNTLIANASVESRRVLKAEDII